MVGNMLLTPKIKLTGYSRDFKRRIMGLIAILLTPCKSTYEPNGKKIHKCFFLKDFLLKPFSI